MTHDCQVVVARHRENLDWIWRLPFHSLVYNKGGDDLPRSISLPNVGREAHTYLTHIVKTYPVFPTWNVFIQGDPFFHLTEDGKAGVDELTDLIRDCMERNVNFQGLAWFRLKCDGLGRPHSMCDPDKKGRWAGWGKDIPVASVFERLFPASAPKEFIARGSTGNFFVSGRRILTRPREFYEYALTLVENDPEDRLNTGHAFERLWQLIFNGNMVLNRKKEEYSVL